MEVLLLINVQSGFRVVEKLDITSRFDSVSEVP